MPRPLGRPRPLPRLAAVVVAVVVMLPMAAAALPVEDFARYQPQTQCAPTPKSGTLQLARWLQREYAGTGSLGIARACGHGGVSEHKEGRAFDWAVNHSSDRDRRYVQSFLNRIFATDRHGNKAALARRMGIMYLIWNDHVYASYRGFAKRDYLSSACRSRSRCSVTLRHRNHVHISLSRAGGRGDTSWYHRNDPRPQPTPQPEPTPTPQPQPQPQPQPDPAPQPDVVPEQVLSFDRKPYARLAVRPDGEPVSARFALRKGTTYKLTAAGLVTYGRPHQVADATCTWSRSQGAWSAKPAAGTRKAYGSLNLMVNGRGRFGTECHDRSHRYTWLYTPKRTTGLTLRIANRREGASGRIVVTVAKRRTDVGPALPTYPELSPAPTALAETTRGYGLLAETVAVPASAGSGVTTRREVEAGARYRVTVSGRADLGAGILSDGQCLRVGDGWFSQASLDRRFPDQDHGNLYVDGLPFAAGTGSCATHEHTADLRATRTGRLHLALWDPLDQADNRGSLTVRVQRLSTVAPPSAAPAQKPWRGTTWTQPRDRFAVSAASARGTTSTMRLRRGETVQLAVTGTVRSHGVLADATCVRRDSSWAPRDPALVRRVDALQLWVDGQRVRWRAVGRPEPCSVKQHSYTARFTARKSGRVRLAVLDLDHRDNGGALRVTLLRRP